MEQAERLRQFEESALTVQDKHKSFFWYQELGNTYVRAGDYTKALDYYLRALKAAVEADDNKLECDALINIGSSYLNLENAHQAIIYFQVALSLAREMQDSRVESIILGKLADANFMLGENNQAVEFFRQGADATKKEPTSADYIETVDTWRSIDKISPNKRPGMLILAIMVILALAIITTGILLLVFLSSSDIGISAALSITTGLLTLLVSLFSGLSIIPRKKRSKKQRTS